MINMVTPRLHLHFLARYKLIWMELNIDLIRETLVELLLLHEVRDAPDDCLVVRSSAHPQFLGHLGHLFVDGSLFLPVVTATAAGLARAARGLWLITHFGFAGLCIKAWRVSSRLLMLPIIFTRILFMPMLGLRLTRARAILLRFLTGLIIFWLPVDITIAVLLLLLLLWFFGVHFFNLFNIYLEYILFILRIYLPDWPMINCKDIRLIEK